MRTRAIPESLRGVFTTRGYTNTRLPLPLPYRNFIANNEWSPVHLTSIHWIIRLGGNAEVLLQAATAAKASEHHRPLTCTELYCLVTEAHKCKRVAQGHCTIVARQNTAPHPMNAKSDAVPTMLPCHSHNTCTDVAKDSVF